MAAAHQSMSAHRGSVISVSAKTSKRSGSLGGSISDNGVSYRESNGIGSSSIMKEGWHQSESGEIAQ